MSKYKIQVSRCLDTRIKNLISGNAEEEYKTLSKATILGFVNGNTINFLGLSGDELIRDPCLLPIGLVYITDKPECEKIRSDIAKLLKNLESIIEQDSLKRFPDEFNSIRESILVYFPDNQSTLGLNKTIWNLDGVNEKGPKISVVDSGKIFNHSSFSKVSFSISVDSRDCLKALKSSFTSESKDFTIKLQNSSFSTNSQAIKKICESLYDHLDASEDIDSMGDILNQMNLNKKERETSIKKFEEKWRNKQKERREPLFFEVTNEKFPQTGKLRIELEVYIYLHLNNSISSMFRQMLGVILYQLELVETQLVNHESLEKLDISFCTFNPDQLQHLVYAVYIIPKSVPVDYENLKKLRCQLHRSYLAPLDRPLFRVSMRVINARQTNLDESRGYLCNVHSTIIDKSTTKGELKDVIWGSYTYHHYMQNGINDSGWGCAYRSLQTIISWFKNQGYIYTPDVAKHSIPNRGEQVNQLLDKLYLESRVPSHDEIQLVLSDVGMPEFSGTKKWIGSQEVCFVLDHLYGISSKFIAVSSGSELVTKARDLGAHFREQSTPVMIGGGVLAHTIIGIDFNDKNGDVSYLILDPHYTDQEDLNTITKKGWCGWKKNSFWDKSAFYNLCLPQRPKLI